MSRVVSSALAAVLAALPTAAAAGAPEPAAADPESGGGQVVEEIVVVGVTPARTGSRSPREIARHLQSATAAELERMQSLDLTEFMNRRFASVAIDSAQGNPLQPDVQFRGYTASPLLGLPQGLAVYQNGARLNEPLGDAVNWDLLAQSAVHRLTLIDGAAPLYGPNSLGGALVLEMKNGFNFEHHQAELRLGSHDRTVWTVESGANNGTLGYFASFSRFDEDGWRNLSPSRADNAYASASWRAERSSLDLGAQWSQTSLTGNGTLPAGLLARDRSAVFTAPDVTDNDALLFTLEARHTLRENLELSASAFHRESDTHSLNGDASDFTVCALAAGPRLLEGLNDEALDELGIEPDEICGEPAFADAAALERFLNARAAGKVFDLEDLTDSLSGTGRLSGEAIDNHSTRDQESRGFDLAIDLQRPFFGLPHHLVAGVRHYRGEAAFDARVELARLDPVTRSTKGLGLGTFVGTEATSVATATETWSLYLHDAVAITNELTVTLAGRFDDTRVTIRDRTGRRPEVEGYHTFSRFNPALGVTWQVSDGLNVYAGVSRSSRAPTPIELTCNESVFERARRRAVDAGGDPGEADVECRLPNAFVADPPLEDVVADDVEIGARGMTAGIGWHLGLFRQVNHDDIVFQTTGRATGLFGAIDRTRRQGVELALTGGGERLQWSVSYTHLDATFQDDFQVSSPAHPFADTAGRIDVEPGDHIPGIPADQARLGVDWRPTGAFALGANLVWSAGSHLRGDEANRLPKTDPYTLVDLRASYRVSPLIELFGRVSNLFDTDYENFGMLAEDPTEVLPDLDDPSPRYLAPGEPRAGWLGVRVRL